MYLIKIFGGTMNHRAKWIRIRFFFLFIRYFFELIAVLGLRWIVVEKNDRRILAADRFLTAMRSADVILRGRSCS